MKTNYAPWYVIAWRLVWHVPMLLAGALFCLLIFIEFGPKAAESAWRDTLG